MNKHPSLLFLSSLLMKKCLNIDNNDRNSKMGCLSIVMTWHAQTPQLIVPVIVIDEKCLKHWQCWSHFFITNDNRNSKMGCSSFKRLDMNKHSSLLFLSSWLMKMPHLRHISWYDWKSRKIIVCRKNECRRGSKSRPRLICSLSLYNRSIRPHHLLYFYSWPTSFREQSSPAVG